MFLVSYNFLSKVMGEPPDGCIEDFIYCGIFAVASTILFAEHLEKTYQAKNDVSLIK